MAETSNIKNISQNVSQCRDGKPWKMTQTRMGWHTLHTHWQTRIGWHTLHTHCHPVCVCVCEAYVILFLFASVCEVYVIPFLFGSFFTVCHPYIDLHFVKCFLCYFTMYKWRWMDSTAPGLSVSTLITTYADNKARSLGNLNVDSLCSNSYCQHFQLSIVTICVQLAM